MRLPDTQHAQQTTDATPSTAATPPSPLTPMTTIINAAMTRAASVSPGDRLIRRADQSHQVATHSRKEESGDGHHHGRHQSRAPTARKVVVDDGDGNHQGSGREDDPLDGDVDVEPRAHRAALAQSLRGLERAFDGPPDRLAHAVERVNRAHQHRSDGDGPHHVVPNRVAHQVPRRGATGRGRAHALGELGIDKKHKGNQHQPGDDPAGKVDGRKARSDNVSNADQRRRSGRCGKRDATGIIDLAQQFLLITEILHHRLGEIPEEADRILENLEPFLILEQLQKCAEPHRAKNVLGSIGVTSLSGLDDLSAGRAFRKGQIRLYAERSAQNDDEENAEQSARQQDQRARPEVAAKVGPETLAANVDHHESGNGKDRASDQRLTHGGSSAREVLLEDAAAEKRQAEKRNGNHRGRNGRRHGLPGLHAKICVGRPKNCGHNNAGQNRLECKFSLSGVVGNERFEVGWFRFSQRLSPHSRSSA